jgi:hypothetical protein
MILLTCQPIWSFIVTADRYSGRTKDDERRQRYRSQDCKPEKQIVDQECSNNVGSCEES